MNDETEDNKIPAKDHKKKILNLRSRAEAAYAKNNFIWAAELYASIYQLNRKENTKYLELFLDAAKKNRNLEPNKTLYSIKAFFATFSFYIKVLKLKNTPENIKEILEALEIIIINDHMSVWAINKLSDMYEKEDLGINGALILESSVTEQKKDIPILEKLGTLFMQAGDQERARKAYKTILKLKPYDQAIEKKLRDMLAMSSIEQSILKKSGYQNTLKDKTSSDRQHIEKKLNKTESEINLLIEYAQKDIRANPENITLQYKLLQLYKDNNDKESVLETLKEICSKTSGDIDILLEKADVEISLLTNKYENDQDKILKEKDKIYKEITDQFPTNIETKYKRAIVLFDLNELDQSLQLFQDSSKVQEYSASSLNYMGLIFKKKNMMDLAIDQFKSGIDFTEKMNETKKELIYNLALTYDITNNVDQALEQYKILYKEDIRYKDVNERIEKAYIQQNKNG